MSHFTSEDQITKYDNIGDNHFSTGVRTPMKSNAFTLSDEQKIEAISFHFKEIMETLGLDLNDDSLKGTPYRFAKMYVKELFSGLNPKNKPSLSVFDNNCGYNKLLVEKNISFSSSCEHHFLPIIGKAHVAYLSSGKIIGLSKINRIVDFYARRPQVQERLTIQIAEEMKRTLDTDDVMVVIEAEHLCVSIRGIEDKTSSTLSVVYDGVFNEESKRNEFFTLLNSPIK